MQLLTIQTQISQARLVASRWLVLSTQELEGEYRGDGCICDWHYGSGVEVERREGTPGSFSRGRAVLSKSVVSLQWGELRDMC